MNGSSEVKVKVKWFKSKFGIFLFITIWKIKYKGNNILKYLSHSRLIIQHIFFHFQNWYFSSMVRWSKSISLHRDILTWINLPLMHIEKGSWNVIKHPLYGSVYAMPIITIFFTGARWWDTRNLLYKLVTLIKKLKFSHFKSSFKKMDWKWSEMGFTTPITI